jgi:hypothetical protein
LDATGHAMTADAETPPDASSFDAAEKDAAPTDAAETGDRFDASATDAGHLDAATPTGQIALFVGNSYTFGNDLPALYQRVVESIQPPVDPLQVEAVTAGGRRLVQHAADAEQPGHRLASLLGANGPEWTQVILQEQSQIPGFRPGQSDYEASVTAAGALATKIHGRGAKVVFLMTWGRRTGDDQNSARFSDFSTMQGHLESGYRALADAARAAGAETLIAPVGRGFAEVWQQEDQRGDPLDPEGLFWRLYDGDGSHPSLLGSYLAACVLTSSMLGIDPRTVSFAPAEIAPEDAQRLREAAHRAVTTWR